MDRSDALTVSANIGGTGDLVKQAAGTTSLTGTNAYTGTTTISNGTLSVGNWRHHRLAGFGRPQRTGTLAFNRSDDITVSTAIGSSLNLAQLGTNT